MIRLKDFPKFPVEFLRQKSEPVKDAKEALEIKQKLKDMFPHHGAFAVAAIQIGIPKRATLIRFPNKKEFTFICNPEVVSQEKPKRMPNEGCLSLPKKHNDTLRYSKIKVKCQHPLLGELDDIVLIADGVEAVILQHEIDHMDGILFKDRLYPYERAVSDKVGRNESCPCNSGKKYKKCCIGETE